jgi:hypothetical protein
MIDRPTYAFGMGFVIAALFNAVLVIAKQSQPGLFAWMSALTGHHWMTHGLLVMAVFFVSGGSLLFIKPQASTRVVTRYIAASTILSTGVIAGYFFVRTLGVYH